MFVRVREREGGGGRLERDHTSLLLSYSCQDNEDQGQSCEVQGALLQVSLHSGGHRQRKGRQTEAVPTTW